MASQQPLTKRLINDAKPADIDTFLLDSVMPGFGVRVHKTGGKSYYWNCRQGRISLGPVGDYRDVEDARDRARVLKRLHQSGINIKRHLAEERRSNEIANISATITVADGIQCWYDANVGRWKKGTLKSYSVYCPKLVAAFGDLPLCDLDTATVIDTLGDPSVATGAFNTKRAMLVSAFKWMMTAPKFSRVLTSNPAERVAKQATKPRDAYFPAVAMAELYQLAETLNPVQCAAVRLQMLLAARSSEVFHLTWDDIDLDAKTITLLGSSTKTRERYVWPLLPEALALIRAQARGNAGNYVFSTNSGARPISADGVLKRLRAAYKNPPREAGAAWRLHDFRRSLGTFIGDTPGFTHDDQEIALNHEGTLHRTYTVSEKLHQKRRILTAWTQAIANG